MSLKRILAEILLSIEILQTITTLEVSAPGCGLSNLDTNPLDEKLLAQEALGHTMIAGLS